MIVLSISMINTSTDPNMAENDIVQRKSSYNQGKVDQYQTVTNIWVIGCSKTFRHGQIQDFRLGSGEGHVLTSGRSLVDK